MMVTSEANRRRASAYKLKLRRGGRNVIGDSSAAGGTSKIGRYGNEHRRPTLVLDDRIS